MGELGLEQGGDQFRIELMILEGESRALGIAFGALEQFGQRPGKRAGCPRGSATAGRPRAGARGRAGAVFFGAAPGTNPPGAKTARPPRPRDGRCAGGAKSRPPWARRARVPVPGRHRPVDAWGREKGPRDRVPGIFSWRDGLTANQREMILPSQRILPSRHGSSPRWAARARLTL